MKQQTKFKQTEIGEIPEEWSLKRLTEISSKIGDGLHSTPKYVDSSEYYFINGNNLFDGSIIITNSTKCVNEGEFKKSGRRIDQIGGKFID